MELGCGEKESPHVSVGAIPKYNKNKINHHEQSQSFAWGYIMGGGMEGYVGGVGCCLDGVDVVEVILIGIR